MLNVYALQAAPWKLLPEGIQVREMPSTIHYMVSCEYFSYSSGVMGRSPIVVGFLFGLELSYAKQLEIYVGLCVHIHFVLMRVGSFLNVCFLVEVVTDYFSLYIEFFLNTKWFLLGKKSRHF